VGTTLTLLESYGAYLYAKQRNLWQQYKNRSFESALAEAAVFGILQQCGVKPEIADNDGGPDFLCADGQFMTKETSFTNEKVTRDTTLQDGGYGG
jgi:hypothetical protein